jgi:hypothetical protein
MPTPTLRCVKGDFVVDRSRHRAGAVQVAQRSERLVPDALSRLTDNRDRARRSKKRTMGPAGVSQQQGVGSLIASKFKDSEIAASCNHPIALSAIAWWRFCQPHLPLFPGRPVVGNTALCSELGNLTDTFPDERPRQRRDM